MVTFYEFQVTVLRIYQRLCIISTQDTRKEMNRPMVQRPYLTVLRGYPTIKTIPSTLQNVRQGAHKVKPVLPQTARRMAWKAQVIITMTMIINARDLNKFAGMHMKGQLLLQRATGCRKKAKQA